MASDETLYCHLFKKEICLGLCSDIGFVASRMLKWEAVPEIAEFTREEVFKACDNCPHVD